jgi:hypothetical protein
MSEGQEVHEKTGQVVVYEAPDGGARVEVVVGDKTVWLSQAEMVKLFGRDRTVITRHIGNVFREGELHRESNVRILHIAFKDHPLSDGNKRTGSLLFLDYLRRDDALLGSNGQSLFSDTALVALALLIAESQPSHKDLVITLVLNLLVEDRP